MITIGGKLEIVSTTDLATKFKEKTFFTDEFSEEIFNQTYRFSGEKSIYERHWHIANNLASVEAQNSREYWREQFLELLSEFKFVPGGRITSNAGTDLRGTTYINCFVSGFRGEDQDSLSSIMDELKRQALILKSEGGYGFCANVMRPRGGFIEGIGSESPGAIKLLEMWDTQSSVITAGSGLKKESMKGKSKIRKGAQMVTLGIWHPDIVEFITAKQSPGRLTKFNMSVLVTDEFMEAVKNRLSWTLEFPDYVKCAEEYKQKWDGNLSKWKDLGLPTKVYRKYGDANELWNILMKSAYSRNEPGVLFIDTINRWNNLYYEEYIQATNPCGEQVLPVGGVCLLGSLNLTQFINRDLTNWDYQKLKKYIPVAVRLMDNVNDITHVPLPENKENLKNKRRIGLGILGYASALMLMKKRYGSTEALDLTEQLASFIMNEAYMASSLLAKEKGCFPDFDSSKYLDGQFVKKLNKAVRDHIAIHGIRNSHLLSIQPTGNSAVLANNVSGGLEPIFSSEYIRTVVQPVPPQGLELPVKIDWQNRNFEKNDEQNWAWVKEGDENLLLTEFKGSRWKIDPNRGLLKESVVMDYAVRKLKLLGQWQPTADWAKTAHELCLDDHINTMEVLSRFVDSAISKTVNLPQKFPFDEFKNVYERIYATKSIKGCTTYREGTMAAVLSVAIAETEKITSQFRAVKRPEALECDVFQVKSNNISWIVLVGILNGKPYEVFAMKQNALHLPPNMTKGILRKAARGVYNLETKDGWVLKNIRKFFESDEHEALTRMISTALRHGADIEFIVDQLVKSEGTVNSFSKAIARTLKHYLRDLNLMRCADCQSKNLKIEEGCFMCTDCGSSKCS